jgi:CelD/BcsL family acetyltransferase involved in cellulose biosynthesis
VQRIQEMIKVEMTYSSANCVNELEIIWLDLQRRSNCHYFLTWDWFGSWLQQVKQPFYLLKATINNQVMALAVIFEKERKVLGLRSTTQWWLNRTGEEELDQSWIEYNDFLIDKKYEYELRHALMLFLSKQDKWSEFIAGMLSNKAEETLDFLSNNKRNIIEDFGYQVNLQDINTSYKSEVLSRNTRQKINQTQRLLSQEGYLSFRVVTLQKEKLQTLNSVGAFHINKWKNTTTPSGFENPTFVSCFKAQLMNKHSEIAELTLNDKPIAYLINYLYKDRVYFYLSAFSNEFEGKIKLGMYLHSLAIEHYREKNLKYYDFLAGKSRYKQSLSNSEYTHNMCSYYKSSLVFSIESTLRVIKDRLDR